MKAAAVSTDEATAAEGAASAADPLRGPPATPQGGYSVSEAIDHLGFGRFQALLLVYTGCAWAADAMEMMLLSFLGPAVRCEWGLSPSQESFITSAVFVGCMVGAYSWGALSDAKGRKIGFFGTALFTFAFGLASACAPNYGALLFCRALVGVGLGGVPVSFALFMEFVPTAQRSWLCTALQGFWTVGSMVEAGLAWAVLNTLGWRWLLGLSSLPLLALALLYPVIPESPFYLASAGRDEEAQAVLERVAKANGKALPSGRLVHSAGAPHSEGPKAGGSASRGAPPLAKARSAASETLEALVGGFRDLGGPSLRLTSALLLLVWFTAALCYYGLVLLTTTLHTTGAAQACQGARLVLRPEDLKDIFISSTAELPGLLAAAAMMNRLGRKWTMAILLALGSGFTWALLGVPQVGLASTVVLFGARACNEGTFATLYVYTPEVYPTRVRSFALGLANALSRFGAITAPALGVDLAGRGGAHLAEGAIAAFGALSAAAAAALPFETAGRTLAVAGVAKGGKAGENGAGEGAEALDDAASSDGSQAGLLEEGQQGSAESRRRAGAAQWGEER